VKLSDLAHRFCPRCAHPMSFVSNHDRTRPVCEACGYIQYLNPSPAAAGIIRRDRRICLVKRRYRPKAGLWTLPAGFMEFDEEIHQTVVREVKEETNLDVRVTGLFDVLTGILPPHFPILLVVFRVEELGGQLQAGDDAEAVGFYPLERLPGPIAFATHRQVLSALGAVVDPDPSPSPRAHGH
jgi:8-oxo-dGTP diphosphatase